MKRRISRVLSYLLVLTILCTAIPLDVFAAGDDFTYVSPSSNPTGNGQSGTDGNLEEPGVMITIGKISNTITSTQKTELAVHNATNPSRFYGDMNYSFDNDWLHQYPNFWTSATIAEKSALIVRAEYTNAPKYGTAQYSHDGITSKTFGGKTATGRSGTSLSQKDWVDRIAVVSSIIFPDSNGVDGLREKFSNKQLTLGEVQQMVAGVPAGRMNVYINNFKLAFNDTGMTAAYFNYISEQIDKGNTPEERMQNTIRAKLDYLDVLVIVNYMSGSKNWGVIENYLKTLNEDGSDEFSMVFMQSVVNAGGDWFSFPTYFKYCTNRPLNFYTGNMDLGGPENNNWGSDLLATEIQNRFNITWANRTQNYVTRSNMFGNGVYAWYANGSLNWKAANAFYPTNKNGNANGTFSWTAYAVAGSRGIISTIPKDGQIYLNATTPFDKINYEGDKAVDPEKVTSTIQISLQQTTDQKNDIEKLFRSEAEKGHTTATLTLEYDLKVIAGGETNINGGYDTKTFADYADKTSTIAGGGAKTEITGLTYADLEPYFSGRKSFSFIDTEIVPIIAQCIAAGKLTNEYGVKGRRDRHYKKSTFPLTLKRYLLHFYS